MSPVQNHLPSSLSSHRYHFQDKVGEGSFSTVYLALSSSSECVKQVAIKRLKRKPNSSVKAQDEETMLSWLKCLKTAPSSNSHRGSQHVVNFIESFVEHETVNLVTEFLAGGSIFELCEKLGPLTEEEAFWIFEQMCLAVCFLHTNHICHRDLKLENWMLDSTRTRVVLIDFGFSAVSDPSSKFTKGCGSLNYLAPEIALGLPYDGKQVDIWALGCILFSLLVGCPPFDFDAQEDDSEFFKQIIRGDFGELPETLSDDAKDLISKLLTVNPRLRLTIDEVLKHPWMQVPQ